MKYLTENGWKDIAKKYKVADNGLSKALAAYEKLDAGKHKERLKSLESVGALERKLKTLLQDGIKVAKANKAKPEVVKNLEEVIKYLAEVDKAVKAAQTQIGAVLAKSKPAVAPPKPELPILDRLFLAAQTMSGAQGGRVKKIMAIAHGQKSSWKSLWYYNSAAVFQFVKYDAKDSVRKQLIADGGGKLPFKGPTWVVQPFSSRLEMHCPKGCPDKNLVTFLTAIDDDIRTSLDPMYKAQGTEVASAFGPLVNEFIKHVGKLAGDPTHLYSAGY